MRRRSWAAAGIAVLLGFGAAAAQAPPPAPVRMGLSGIGEGLFARSCAGCHGSIGVSEGDPRAPKLETLRQYPPERIYQALTDGKMQVQGAAFTDPQRREIAEWLSARYLGAAERGDAKAMPNRCAVIRPIRRLVGWNGWSTDTANTRFQTAAAGLTAADLPKLKLKWAFGLPGGVQVFSQPTVVDGALFIGTDSGQVYALDAATGCVRWSFLADAAVRTAPVVAAARPGTRLTVIVGDMKAKVYALDARDGRPIWTARADDLALSRITGAPTAYGGRLYVPVSSGEEGSARLPGYECCHQRGSIVALDLADGRQVWKTYMVPEPPQPSTDAAGKRRWGPAGGAVWSSPTVDPKRRRIYVTTGDSYAAPAARLTDAIVALEMDTGAVAWAYQDTPEDVWVAGCTPANAGSTGCAAKVGPDWDFAASAMLQKGRSGRDLVVSGHKGGVAMAVDPDRNGALVWRTNLAAKPPTPKGDIVFGGAADPDNAYFALQESSALVALDLERGTRRWTVATTPAADRASHAGAGAAVTGLPGAVLSGGWDGILRAVSTRDGRELWTFDSAKPFKTVNGVEAKGGSMGGPGATVAGGMLFVGSGYVGVSNGMPGNVLLAFGR